MRSFIIAAAFALMGFKAGATPVPLTINLAFQSSFPSAAQPVWSTEGHLYKASFQQGNEQRFAFFTADGLLTAEARYVNLDQLPKQLQIELFKKYPDRKIVTLFEITSESDVDYYITLEAGNSTLQLQAPQYGKWKAIQQPAK